MNKRGQGLPMNVIIIAAIALLVLVVLSIVFVSNISQTNTQLNNCEEAEGHSCQPAAAGCGSGRQTSSKVCYKTGTKEVDQTEICCINI